MKKKKIIILLVAVLLIAAAIITTLLIKKNNGSSEPDLTQNSQNVSEDGQTVSENITSASNENGEVEPVSGDTSESSNIGSTSASQGKNPSKVTEGTTSVNAAIPFENAYILDGIIISPVYSFTGEYVEDGSDEKVKKVAAVKIKNASDKNIEYMKINVDCSGDKYSFTVMTLPVGETITVFESNKKKFSGKDKVTSAEIEQIAYFNSKMTIYPDIFAIYPSVGIITVRNISGSDVSGDVYVYYKGFDENGLYGGITYRVRIQGIKAGETIQVPAAHYSVKKSKVVFVSYAQAD